MKVQCRINNLNEIPDKETRNRLSECIHRQGPDEDLIVGEIYNVFALARWSDGGLRVYLHTIAESDHPNPYPLEMFEIVDATLPPNWLVNFEQQQGGLAVKLISFVEWHGDGQFYEKLVDGDEQAIAAYKLQRLNVQQRRAAVA